MTRWRALVAQSPLRKLGGEVFVASLASLVPKGLGFAKEILVAALFGLSDNLDIYLMAFVLIGFPLSVFLNAIQAMLISNLSKDGAVENDNLYASTSVFTALLLAVVLIAWLLFLHLSLPWVASSFSSEKLLGLESALYYLIPYYFLNIFNILAYGVLQAKRQFLANGLIPGLTPLAIMVLVYFYTGSGSWEILAISLVIGSLAECIWLHARLFQAGLLVLPKLFNNSRLTGVYYSSMALIPGSAMLAIGPVIDQSIAASLGSGVVSMLAYGYRLPAALAGILVTAVGITILPYFSSLLGENKSSYCLHSFNRLSFWLLTGGLVLIMPMFFYSAEIVGFLYQRGLFDATATEFVTPIQQVYLLQLPFTLITMLCIRTLIAMAHNKLVSLLAGTGVVFQAGFAIWLGHLYGAIGIALAAMIVSICLAAVSFIYARIRLRSLIV